MNTQITLDHLDQLNLHGMARAYQAVLSMPRSGPTFHKSIYGSHGRGRNTRPYP